MLFGGLTRMTFLGLGVDPFKAYTPIWSTEILGELRRNLRMKSQSGPREVDLLLHDMRHAFPDAAVDPAPGLVDLMPNHRKDRHVLAVAVTAQAPLLVTNNLRDFRGADQWNVQVNSPDDFLSSLFGSQPDVVRGAMTVQAATFNAPITVEELLVRFETIGLTQFAARLRSNK